MMRRVAIFCRSFGNTHHRRWIGESNLLHGVKILDLSRILAAPFCTQLLADMGATVYKIEHPETGDDTSEGESGRVMLVFCFYHVRVLQESGDLHSQTKVTRAHTSLA